MIASSVSTVPKILFGGLRVVLLAVVAGRFAVVCGGEVVVLTVGFLVGFVEGILAVVEGAGRLVVGLVVLGGGLVVGRFVPGVGVSTVSVIEAEES
jgi:hypothetical protein